MLQFVGNPFKFIKTEVANECLVIPEAIKAMPPGPMPLASPQNVVTAIHLSYTVADGQLPWFAKLVYTIMRIEYLLLCAIT